MTARRPAKAPAKVAKPAKPARAAKVAKAPAKRGPTRTSKGYRIIRQQPDGGMTSWLVVRIDGEVGVGAYQSRDEALDAVEADRQWLATLPR